MCIAMDELIADEVAKVLVSMIENYMQKTAASLKDSCEILGITEARYNEAKQLLEQLI